MNLAGVMDDLSVALETIPGLRVFPYWADKVTPPAAIVGWPEPLTFDRTFGRGSDQVEIPVYVVVGKVDARSSRDRLAKYADGSGDHSVKTAVEEHQATAFDSARISRVEFDVMTISAVDYLAATFYIDITGKGA